MHIVEQAANAFVIDATMPEPSVQIELDGMDRSHPERRVGQRFATAAKLTDMVGGLLIGVGELPDLVRRRVLTWIRVRRRRGHEKEG